MNKNKTGFYSGFISVLVLLIGVCGYFLYYFFNLSDNDVDTNAFFIKEFPIFPKSLMRIYIQDFFIRKMMGFIIL